MGRYSSTGEKPIFLVLRSTHKKTGVSSVMLFCCPELLMLFGANPQCRLTCDHQGPAPEGDISNCMFTHEQFPFPSAHILMARDL